LPAWPRSGDLLLHLVSLALFRLFADNTPSHAPIEAPPLPHLPSADCTLQSFLSAQVATTDGDKQLQIAVCKTACSDSAGACDSDGNSLGTFNEAPYVLANTVHLFYSNGGECPTNKDRKASTQINFVCDTTVSNDDPVVEFVDTTDDCINVVQWRTPDVCGPTEQTTPCLIRDFYTGESYDLSVLTRGTSNWAALDTRENNDTYTYYLNVCRTLINPVPHDPTHECFGAGACQTKPQDATFPNYAIGDVQEGPQMKDGVITLTYSSNRTAVDRCNGKARSTTIIFTCKYGTLGQPRFDREVNCEYVFNWATSAACSLRRTVGSDCRVKDKVTGLEFDLSPLEQHRIDLPDDVSIWVKPCDVVHLESKPAACTDAGACRGMDNKVFESLGAANSELFYADGGLSLVYTLPKCKANPDEAFTTTIAFECDPDATETRRPTLLDSDDCSVTILWRTAYACTQKQQADCILTDEATGRQYDLSALERTLDPTYWQASHESDGHDYEYLINVCKPLGANTARLTKCDPNAGVCQLEGGPDGHVYNLGGVASPEINNGSLQMRYLNGDTCGETGFVREAIIDFVCGESESTDYPLGRPVFKRELDSKCIYEFEWKTPEACPIKVVKGENCKVTVPVTGQVIDLTPLSKEAYSFSDEFSHDYEIQICGDGLKDGCGTGKTAAGICQHASNDMYYSLGSPSSQLYLTEEVVTLTFEDGTRYNEDSSCGKVPRTAQIEFRCQPCATKSSPLLLKEERCTYYFVWLTSLVCPPERTCGPTPSPSPSPTPSPTPSPGPSPGPSPSPAKAKKSNTGMVAGIAVVVVLVVIIALVILVRKRVVSCGRSNSYSVMSVNSFVADDEFDDDDLEEA
jgi:insulin-like growth factor 2 receptor